MHKKVAIIALTIMAFMVLTLSVSGAGAVYPDTCPEENQWNGSVNDNWSNASNWDCGVVPNRTSVTIPKVDNGNYPVVPASLSLVLLNDLIVEKGASFHLNGRTLSMTGDLTNRGMLIDIQTIPDPGVFPFNAYFFDVGGYGGLTLSRKLVFDLFDPGPVTVRIKGKQFCDNGNSTVMRCFDITPTIVEHVSVNATFYFAKADLLDGMDCQKLTAFHWYNKAWALAGDNAGNDCLSTLSSPNYSVSVENITSFSPFALSQGAPTAVSVVDFNVSSVGEDVLLIAVLLLAVGTLTTLEFLKRRKYDVAT